jgi:hypothetical protein
MSRRFLGLLPLSLNFFSFSKSDSTSIETPSDCETYNSMLYCLRPSLRLTDCNRDQRCVFEGKGWTGHCKSRQFQYSPEKVQFVLLMKDSVASSVADSIFNAHDAAHEVAKELVIEVLQNKDNLKNLDILLRKVLIEESVLSPTRDLVYYYLHSDVIMRNILWLLSRQRQFYFRGAGKVVICIFFSLCSNLFTLCTHRSILRWS